MIDALPGDNLSVVAAGKDFSDLDFKVDRRDQLEAGQKIWYEVSGPYHEIRVRLEIIPGDILEVRGWFDGRTITLDEIALTEDDLASMDERQNPADFFDFDGKFWLFRWSREVGLFHRDQDTGTGFYCWEFQEQDGDRFMQIRKYEGEPFTAYILNKVNPGDVTVFRGK
ncbi:MAG TPA: hypothetical protein VGL72_33590 [Bryobacteraceae bacterium]